MKKLLCVIVVILLVITSLFVLLECFSYKRAQEFVLSIEAYCNDPEKDISLVIQQPRWISRRAYAKLFFHDNVSVRRYSLSYLASSEKDLWFKPYLEMVVSRETDSVAYESAVVGLADGSEGIIHFFADRFIEVQGETTGDFIKMRALLIAMMKGAEHVDFDFLRSEQNLSKTFLVDIMEYQLYGSEDVFIRLQEEYGLLTKREQAMCVFFCEKFTPHPRSELVELLVESDYSKVKDFSFVLKPQEKGNIKDTHMLPTTEKGKRGQKRGQPVI